MTDERITDLAMDVLREGKEGREMELATDVLLVRGELARLRELTERQRRELAHANEVLHRKNVELDALHYVWCSGACATGTHRYGEHPRLTWEMVAEASRNTERLHRRMRNLQARQRA